MREAPTVPTWLWLWLLAWGPGSRAWKRDEMPSHSRARTLDSLYISPQYAVALTVGTGKLLAAWSRSNCGIQHTSDGGLLITGHQCYEVPTVDMSTWPVPASGIAMHLTSVRYLSERSFAGYGPAHHVRRLEMLQNKITNIRRRSFVGFSNVTFLNLADNPIKFLSGESFVGLDSLKVLILFRTWLHEFSTVVAAISPHVLPSLEILNLGGTQIWRIEEHDLVPMENSSLKHLQINLCDTLAFMHPHALKPLKHLEGFYFRDNLNMQLDNIVDVITNITQETFRVIDVSQPVSKTATYTILESVSSTTAEIVIFIRLTDATLTKDFFPLMPRVKCIVLESGKIRDFKPKAVANLPNLEEISFVRNQFLGIPSGILEPRLKVLDLSGYDRGFIQLDVPDYVFDKMSNLRELYLRYKALPSLTEFTFWGLVSLENLDLKKCSIDSLPEGVFKHLRKLKHINLSRNPIFRPGSSVNMRAFQGISSLRTLMLSDTKLTDLTTSLSFEDLQSLEYMDLSNNSISVLPDGFFKTSHNLEHLNLRQNLIDSWKPARSCLEKLKSLDLSVNKIRYLDPDALGSFDRLHILDLSENVFSCTCGIRHFVEWLKDTNVTVRYLPYTALYACSDPLELDGRAILSVGSLLQRTCKPTVLVSIACVGVVILVFISLLVAGYIYRHRFNRWLRSQSTACSAANKAYLYDAFVSYCNSDTQWVISRLLPQLECSTIGNLKLCVYDRDFVAGRNISECILESIKQSRKIILVLSNSFLQSPWCKFETDLAQYTLLEENRDAFILLKISRLDETLLSPKLNYLLKTRIHLSWSQSPKEEVAFFTKLHKALTDDGPRPHCEERAPVATKRFIFFKKIKRKATLV
ncbi:toll-like receptor 2 [Dermacentor albipictus]|uniref:toll-like receptor 2 n=1 Tax=Dermacentor albipictus TaxID=60249 RepID=UPI0031FC0902